MSAAEAPKTTQDSAAHGGCAAVPCSAFVLRAFPKPCFPRKRHWCRICGGVIAIKEPCCRWSYVERGEGYGTSHAHPECYAITQRWDDGDWESWEPEGPRQTPPMVWQNDQAQPPR